MKIAPALLALGALSAVGCASVVTGTTQVIRIESDPEGAVVDVDGLQIGTTPRQVKIKRGATKSVMVHKDGYEIVEVGKKLNGWFVGNLFLGVLPGLIDIANGSWMWANPDVIQVKLWLRGQRPPPPPPPPPPAKKESKPKAKPEPEKKPDAEPPK